VLLEKKSNSYQIKGEFSASHGMSCKNTLNKRECGASE
jgi:hypothetical protein